MELLPPNLEDNKQINEKGGSIKRSLDIQAIEYSIKHPIKAINSYLSIIFLELVFMSKNIWSSKLAN